ncbi:MAG: hypothetical protein KA347_02700 [Bacteroidia bacterium]|jgi:hypothetical protein|nr:hypothetical protein [Bacteroidia bacterium]MBP7244669.1 hypothetical protein [Bacteroidia bacterium]
MNKLFVNLLIVGCVALSIQGSPIHDIDEQILIKWRSDPWGCNDVRDGPMMDKILMYASVLDHQSKLELFYKLGEPDKLIYYRGKKRSYYYIDCRCVDGKAIPNTQGAELEVIQDSLNIYFTFAHY